MAAAVLVFKDSMKEAERLRTAASETAHRVAAEHQATCTKWRTPSRARSVVWSDAFLEFDGVGGDRAVDDRHGEPSNRQAAAVARRRRRQAPACRPWPRPQRN